MAAGPDGGDETREARGVLRGSLSRRPRLRLCVLTVLLSIVAIACWHLSSSAPEEMWVVDDLAAFPGESESSACPSADCDGFRSKPCGRQVDVVFCVGFDRDVWVEPAWKHYGRRALQSFGIGWDLESNLEWYRPSGEYAHAGGCGWIKLVRVDDEAATRWRSK